MTLKYNFMNNFVYFQQNMSRSRGTTGKVYWRSDQLFSKQVYIPTRK